MHHWLKSACSGIALVWLGLAIGSVSPSVPQQDSRYDINLERRVTGLEYQTENIRSRVELIEKQNPSVAIAVMQSQMDYVTNIGKFVAAAVGLLLIQALWQIIIGAKRKVP